MNIRRGSSSLHNHINLYIFFTTQSSSLLQVHKPTLSILSNLENLRRNMKLFYIMSLTSMLATSICGVAVPAPADFPNDMSPIIPRNLTTSEEALRRVNPIFPLIMEAKTVCLTFCSEVSVYAVRTGVTVPGLSAFVLATPSGFFVAAHSDH